MTYQIIDNKTVREASNFKKFLLAASFLLFLIGFNAQAFANEPQTSHDDHTADAVDQHDAHAHDSDHADAHSDAHADSHSDAHADEHGVGEFMPGDMIMHHIADAHDWHLFDFDGKSYSINLPIIVYKSGEGLIGPFSSGRFEHGHASYNGLKLDHGKIVNADPADEAKLYDLSITKNVAAIFVSVLLLVIILLTVANGYKKRKTSAPKGIQSVLEPIIIFIRDEVVKPSIGKGYERFMPLLLTIFFFIFFNNLLGLIPIAPFGANVTGNIAVTMVLATIVFIVTTFIAKKDYWKHIFLPDVPIGLYIIMIPIEIMGMFIKPIVLMLRLFANITAGHIIILGFMSLIFIFGSMGGEINMGGGIGTGIFSVAFSVFMSILELLVAFLQAYVFTLLSAIYFGAALEEHHEH